MNPAEIFLTNELTPAQRVVKAKIGVFKSQPFFSRLLDKVRIVEKAVCQTMAVDPYSNMFYNPEFVTSISNDELIGCVLHETMHLAFRHHMRIGNRKVLINGYPLFYIACDIQINNVIAMNGFQLPQCGIIPRNNSVTWAGIQVNDISDKSCEDIYEELKNALKQKAEDDDGGQGDGQGDGDSITVSGLDMEGSHFDEHLWEGNSPADEEGDEEQEGKGSGTGDGNNEADGEMNKPFEDTKGAEQDAKEWERALTEALTQAKVRGNMPAGMEREFDNLHKGTINWRTLLKTAVRSVVPNKLSITKPNRNYIWRDMYLPSVVGESVSVLVAIDTSGSVGNEDLADFLSEMVGITRMYTSVEFRVLTHDVDVHDDVKITNANIEKIKQIKCHGGGGTSHIPLYEYIKTKKYIKETKLLISFTDGYSSFPDDPSIKIKTIFVLGGSYRARRDEMPDWSYRIIEIN